LDDAIIILTPLKGRETVVAVVTSVVTAGDDAGLIQEYTQQVEEALKDYQV
jgi:hypothetical protein